MKRLLLSISIISFLTSTKAVAQQAMTLKDCVEYSLKNNRNVKIYDNYYKQAKEKAREAISAYLPQVNVNASLDDNLKLPVTVIPAGAFGPGSEEQRVSFGTKYNASHSAQVDQAIFNKTALTGIKARDLNLENAENNIEANRVNLIYSVASSYYQIIIAQKQLELLEDNKRRLEQTLKITELQAAQGVIKKVDVKQVQVNLKNTESQISITKNQYELALNNLKFYTGLPLNESLTLVDTARWLNNPKDAKVGALNNFNFENTVSYKQQKTQLSLLELNKQSIKDGFYPTLGFYARYGNNGYANTLGDAYRKLYDFSSIGLSFKWSIFTGFRRDAQYKQANYDYLNAKENLELTRQQQELSYLNANSQFTRAQSTIGINKQNMDLATEVYENVMLQHKNGIASLTDLLNAENSYKSAQSNYIQSLLDFYLADLEVRKANNTLEEFISSL